MTSMLVMGGTNGTYYRIFLNYAEKEDKFQCTMKDLAKRAFLCQRQDLPSDFVRSGVDPEDLNDPKDLLQSLKERVVSIVKNEAHLIK